MDGTGNFEYGLSIARPAEVVLVIPSLVRWISRITGNGLSTASF